MGCTRWKRVSDKKLSARKRAVFRDKRHQTARIPSSGGTLPLPSGEVRGHEHVSEKADACPICGEPLREMEYTGKKELASLPLGDSMQPLKEDGEVVWHEVRKGSALLSCVFLPDVLCSHRKSARFYMMDRCSACSHYLRFEREMDKEDKETMDEFDETRRTGVHT